MQTNLRKNILSGFVIVLTIMLASPLVAAQQNEAKVNISGPTSIDGIRPGLGSANLVLEIEFRFVNQGTSVAAQEDSTAQVVMTPDCDNNQFTVIGPGVVFVTVAAGQTSGTTTETYGVSATREAPGLTEIPCSMTAQSRALGQGTQASQPYTHRFSAIADYYGAMQVQLASTIERAAPQKEVPFNLDFTNFGNAETRLRFLIANEADAPPAEERWDYILPPELIVGSVAKGSENTASAVFQITTPYKTGWNNEVGRFTVTMETEALNDPSQKGNTLQANVLVRVRGVFVPGFEVVGLVGSLLGAVVLIRRRGDGQE